MKTPAAKREVLVLTAGLVWSAVGLWLIATAVRWIIPFESGYSLSWLIVGGAAGVVIYRYGFSRLAATNISRIFLQAPGKDKVCLFSFQNTKSYFIIIIMICLGYLLRHLPVSKVYIVPVYSAIGLALLLSSLNYYRRLRA